MTLIKIKQAQSGQSLKSDAIGLNGRILLSTGTTLNDKHLEVLKSWGVVEIDVVGDNITVNEEIAVHFDNLPAKTKQQIIDELNDRFSLCDQNHPFIKELYLALRNRMAQKLLSGENR